jgi:hypothetical protein
MLPKKQQRFIYLFKKFIQVMLNHYMGFKSALLLGPVGAVRAVEGDRVGVMLGVDVSSHIPRVGRDVRAPDTGQQAYAWFLNRVPVIH